MKKLLTAIVLTAVLAGPVAAADYVRKPATDYAFPVILVDEVDGYTPETEKKFGDTTITYCAISDGNTPSTYTDDATLWTEIGNTTGDYKLIMGAGEFTADNEYFVKVVVSGCRIYRFTVSTVNLPVDVNTVEGEAPATSADSAAATKTLMEAAGSTLATILIDTAALDTTTEFRIMATGTDTPVAKEISLTDSTTGLSAIVDWLKALWVTKL